MKLINKSHPFFYLLLFMGVVSIGLASEEITPLTQAGQKIAETQRSSALSV